MNMSPRSAHHATIGLLATVSAFATFFLSGCGGGNNGGTTPSPTATPAGNNLAIAAVINSTNVVASPADLSKGLFAFHAVTNTNTLSDGVVYVFQGATEIANSKNLGFAALGINTAINPRLVRDAAVGNVMACMGRADDNSYFRVIITDLDTKNSFVIMADDSNPTFQNLIEPVSGAGLHYEDPFLFTANGQLYLLCKQRSKLPNTDGLCLFAVDKAAKSAKLIAQITDNGAELSMPIVGANNTAIVQKVTDTNGGRAIVSYPILEILKNALATGNQPYQYTAAGNALVTGVNYYLPQPTYDGILIMQPDASKHDKVYYQRLGENTVLQLPLGVASSDYSDAYPLYSDSRNLIIAYSVNDGSGYKLHMAILNRANENAGWQYQIDVPLDFKGANALGATFRSQKLSSGKGPAILHAAHAVFPQ